MAGLGVDLLLNLCDVCRVSSAVIIGKVMSGVATQNKRGSVGENENVRSKTPPAMRQQIAADRTMNRTMMIRKVL